MRPFVPLVTCEHAGNRIPAPLRLRFRGQETLLASHRGWDPGAAGLARRLARRLDAPLLMQHVSRLVVDANRSLGHPRLHGDAVRTMPAVERQRIVARWWRPHRSAVEAQVAELCGHGRVFHCAVHSFTPELDGERRDFDVGLLYDPARATERRLALSWQAAIRGRDDSVRVLRNRPYLGRSDGLCTSLRRKHGDARYCGFELELNHGLLADPKRWRRVCDAVIAGLVDAVPGWR